ncbi:MAG: hypothetical protein ACOH1I_05520 [Gallionellaceae bacterium]
MCQENNSVVSVPAWSHPLLDGGTRRDGLEKQLVDVYIERPSEMRFTFSDGGLVLALYGHLEKGGLAASG